MLKMRMLRCCSIALLSTVAFAAGLRPAFSQDNGSNQYPQPPAQAAPPAPGDQGAAPPAPDPSANPPQASSPPDSSGDGQGAAPPPAPAPSFPSTPDAGAPLPPAAGAAPTPDAGATPAPAPATPQPPQASAQNTPPASSDLTIVSTMNMYCSEMERLLGHVPEEKRAQLQQNPFFRTGPVDQKLYVKGKKERVDFDNVAILYDQVAPNQAAIIDPFANDYSILDVSDDDQPEILSGVPTVTNTGEKMVIAGHPAAHYTVHGDTVFGKLTGDVWAATDMADIDQGFYDQSLSLQALWSQIPGYVLYEDVAVYDDQGGKVTVLVRITDVVHSITQADLPANYFVLPPGFKRVPLGPNGLPYTPPPPKPAPTEDQTAT